MFQKTSKSSNEEVQGTPTSERSTSTPKKEKSPKSSGGTNVILSDVEIQGTVKFKNDVVIDGKIDGEIFSDGRVTIGGNATVNAEIRSASVVVEGCVNGNIYASERLELMEDAEVTGDIKAAVLSMEAGAVLIGTSSIGAAPSKKDSSPSKENSSSRSRSREDRELAHA